MVGQHNASVVDNFIRWVLVSNGVIVVGYQGFSRCEEIFRTGRPGLAQSHHRCSLAGNFEMTVTLATRTRDSRAHCVRGGVLGYLCRFCLQQYQVDLLSDCFLLSPV